ncbi:MAG: hypothetical protein KGH79_03100 [Patescibacteria group bacterium]|nr:hypothetical protein [Patescibacteria group bacterium]
MGKFYAGFRKRLGSYGLEAYYVMLVLLYFMLIWIPFHWDEWVVVAGFLLAFLPFVLPVLLGIMLSIGWLEYKRQEDYWSTEYTVLEVKLPEEITQSPQAAELFLRVLYQSGEVDTPVHALRGKTRAWFSLEIASNEGAVRFYVWTRSRYADIVKAQLYAHYPTVQIVAVPDYTLAVPLDLETMDIWGVEQAMQKPDPYPIMTYPAWGLDKASEKEEFKNDPLVSILEFMGSIGPGEYLWFQILLEGHAGKSPPSYCPQAMNFGVHERVNLEEWAQIEIDEIGKKTKSKKPEEKDRPPNFMSLTEGDKEKVKAIQQKLNKQAFDVGIRFIYLAKKENLQSSRRAGIPTALRSFEHGSEGRGLNGLKPVFYIGPFDYPWQDFRGIRRRMLKRKLYNGYVTRQYFYAPFKNMHIVLNIEEIASLWHFPGKVAHTPTLIRMPSRRAEAPANLPV